MKIVVHNRYYTCAIMTPHVFKRVATYRLSDAAPRIEINFDPHEKVDRLGDFTEIHKGFVCKEFPTGTIFDTTVTIESDILFIHIHVR